MEVLIRSANGRGANLIDYKEDEILKKHNYKVDEERNEAYIEINTIEELFQLSKELGYDLIVDGVFDYGTIVIHDNWIE